MGIQLDEDAIFRRALLIPSPRQRSRFLDHTCGNDKHLRDRLSRLLEADETNWSLFDSFIHKRCSVGEPLEKTPQIENFHLIEKIGEGGMAEVYSAEQLTPFRREVAVKIQRTSDFVSKTTHHFQSEKQTLAKLKHENIATIYDAGTTSDGKPYVSMELVKGEPITTFCNDLQLNIRERLELMQEVWKGIEYAHHYGVIHRDLKPANILITEAIHGPIQQDPLSQAFQHE